MTQGVDKTHVEPEEIEVTKEMIEAGAAILMGFSTYFRDEESWAEDVYRAMVAARKETKNSLVRLQCNPTSA
jgi:hypothetical protein